MNEIDQIKKLAGIKEFAGYQPWEGSNISVTGNEKGEIMKQKNIQPGTEDWFKLWFTIPGMTGPLAQTPGFRSRTKHRS